MEKKDDTTALIAKAKEEEKKKREKEKAEKETLAKEKAEKEKAAKEKAAKDKAAKAALKATKKVTKGSEEDEDDAAGRFGVVVLCINHNGNEDADGREFGERCAEPVRLCAGSREC